MIYYPCPGILNDDSVECEQFSLHQYYYRHSVFCKKYKEEVKLLKRGKKRIKNSTTRKRPYHSLSTNDKHKAYEQRQYQVKI